MNHHDSLASGASSSRQITIGDAYAKVNEAEERRNIKKDKPAVCNNERDALSILDRQSIKVQTRSILLNYFLCCHLDLCVNDIKDRKPAGFNVELRKGHSLHTITVCGISRVINDRIATEEGTTIVNSIYSGSAGVRKFGVLGAPIESSMGLSASEMGQRIHQLIYHQIECELPQSLLSESEDSDDRCSCLSKIYASEWHSDELLVGTRIFNHIKNTLNLVPIASELFLWNPVLQMATRIDLLCLTEHMTFVLISLKTGRHGRHNTPGDTCKFFRPPLNNVPDTIQNRHLIQLLLEVLLLTRQYFIPISDAFIMFVHLDEMNLRKNNDNASDKEIPISIQRPAGLLNKLNITPSAILDILTTMSETNTLRNK